MDYLAVYSARKAEEAAALHPRVVKAASDCDVMHDQVDFLCEHVAEFGAYHVCSICRRYQAAKAVLEEPFSDRKEMALAVATA